MYFILIVCQQTRQINELGGVECQVPSLHDVMNGLTLEKNYSNVLNVNMLLEGSS